MLPPLIEYDMNNLVPILFEQDVSTSEIIKSMNGIFSRGDDELNQYIERLCIFVDMPEHKYVHDPYIVSRLEDTYLYNLSKRESRWLILEMMKGCVIFYRYVIRGHP